MNEVGSLGTSKEKKPHTSFDYPQNIPKIKNKLDIINEVNDKIVIFPKSLISKFFPL